MADAGYTAQDHEFRENDHYARAKYAITLRWLGPADNRRLLNIGCGAGLFNGLAHDAGFRVESCEPDPVACAAAVAAAPPGVCVHEGGLFDAPVARDADVLVMHDVLEHIEDDAKAVARLAELVRPGGRVVLSVPALTRLFGLHDEMLGHFRRYDRGSLTRVLGDQFAIERMRYFGFTFIPVTAWYSRWRRQPYPTGPAGSSSLIGNAFAAFCRAEARLPLPLGTALLVDATRSAAV